MAVIRAGFVLSGSRNRKFYFACDTALFYDMKLIGEQGIDVAVLPIGDQFTMGPTDAIRATKLSSPRSWFPRITTPGLRSIKMPPRGPHQVLAETTAEPRVISPGGKIVLNAL